MKFLFHWECRTLHGKFPSCFFIRYHIIQHLRVTTGFSTSLFETVEYERIENWRIASARLFYNMPSGMSYHKMTWWQWKLWSWIFCTLGIKFRFLVIQLLNRWPDNVKLNTKIEYILIIRVEYFGNALVSGFLFVSQFRLLQRRILGTWQAVNNLLQCVCYA